MSLSTEQIYLLNTLTYISKKDVYDAANHEKISDFVEGILNSDHVLNSIVHEEGFMSAEQVRSVCEQIKADNQLMNMDIAYADRTDGGADRIIFTTQNEQGEKEAIVAFEGTMGGNEWRDNFLAGTATDQRDGVSSEEQVKTLSWFKTDPDVQAALKDCDTITVSGHSKGGNKAKYLALFDERVDECVSFDGQGFSDEFVKKYENVIRANQDKIQNYNHKSDFVNTLLNDVGEAHFINGKDCGTDLFQNHSIFSLNEGIPFAENETEQWGPMKELDRVLNGYLRTLDPAEKKNFIGLLAELAGDFLEKPIAFGADDLLDYIIRLKFGGLELLKGFLAYAIAYGSLEFCELIERWVKESMPWLSSWIEQIRKVAEFATGVNDGEDICYPSMVRAGTPVPAVVSGTAGKDGQIVMDTNELRSLSAQAASLSAVLSSCGEEIEACAALCEEYSINLNMTLSLHLKLNASGTGLFSATPAQTLRGIRKELGALSMAVARISNGLTKAANQFESNEQRIIAYLPQNTGESAAF